MKKKLALASKKKLVILFTTKTTHHLALINEIAKFKNIEFNIFYIKEKKIKKTNFLKKIDKFEKKFFSQNNIDMNFSKIYHIDNLNSKKTISIIKKKKPNVGILFGTKKVSLEFINIFGKNLINIHRGIMEKYRGLDSEYWACFNKDFKSIGTTIHVVDTFLDKGKIILQKKIKLNKLTKCYKLRYLTTMIAIENINKIIKKILIGNVIYKKKQNIGKYYSSISKNYLNKGCNYLHQYCKNL